MASRSLTSPLQHRFLGVDDASIRRWAIPIDARITIRREHHEQLDHREAGGSVGERGRLNGRMDIMDRTSLGNLVPSSAVPLERVLDDRSVRPAAWRRITMRRRSPTFDLVVIGSDRDAAQELELLAGRVVCHDDAFDQLIEIRGVVLAAGLQIRRRSDLPRSAASLEPIDRRPRFAERPPQLASRAALARSRERHDRGRQDRMMIVAPRAARCEC